MFDSVNLQLVFKTCNPSLKRAKWLLRGEILYILLLSSVQRSFSRHVGYTYAMVSSAVLCLKMASLQTKESTVRVNVAAP